MNWVMLRGLGRHSDHWGIFADKMRDAFGEIMLIDLPGIAGEVANVPISISDITDHIRKQYLERKNAEPWGLMAISLGGMIAMDWASRYPEDFVQLVTINSSSSDLSKFYQRMQPGAIREVFKAVFASDVYKREKIILDLTCNMKTIDEAAILHNVEIAKKMTINKKVFFKQLFAATKFKTPYAIKIPYTILAAKKDRLAHFTCSEALSKRFNAHLVLHESAGHDLPADDPDWVVARIKEC